MKLYQLLTLTGLILVACSTGIKDIPTAVIDEPVVIEQPKPEIEIIIEKPKMPIIDDTVWQSTGRTIKIKGCEDWKARNPEADC